MLPWFPGVQTGNHFTMVSSCGAYRPLGFLLLRFPLVHTANHVAMVP